MKTSKTRGKTISEMPSIEDCFEIYLRGTQIKDIDPLSEDQQRHAYFCGFKSCLQAIDLLAEIAHFDEDEGETAFQRLIAEFERFAQGQDSGESTVNH